MAQGGTDSTKGIGAFEAIHSFYLVIKFFQLNSCDVKFLCLLLFFFEFCLPSSGKTERQIEVEVPAGAAPWDFSKDGINSGFSFGKGGHKPPVVIQAEGELKFQARDFLRIKYQSKRARSMNEDYDNSSDSEGELLRLVNSLHGYSRNVLPSFYISKSEYPVFLMALIGVFTDGSGVLVGSPFRVGLQKVVQVPAGSTRIQFGVNDDVYGDNSGSYLLLIEKLPPPQPVAPQVQLRTEVWWQKILEILWNTRKDTQ